MKNNNRKLSIKNILFKNAREYLPKQLEESHLNIVKNIYIILLKKTKKYFIIFKIKIIESIILNNKKYFY